MGGGGGRDDEDGDVPALWIIICCIKGLELLNPIKKQDNLHSIQVETLYQLTTTTVATS